MYAYVEVKYINELLRKSAAVVKKADKRQNVNIDFGYDEVSI